MGNQINRKLLLYHDMKVKKDKEELSRINDEPGKLNLRSDKYIRLDVQLKNSVNVERLLGIRHTPDGED